MKFLSLLIITTCYISVGYGIEICDKKLAAKMKYNPREVIIPSGSRLPFRCEGNIKVFELQSEEVFNLFHTNFEPGPVYLWGYNGSSPGPLIEAVEGETIRVVFKNKLPEATTVHWHGIELPIDMDGASGFSHPPVRPGGTYVYEFPLKQSGTYMYHSGHSIPKQLAMGLSGFFVIHPQKKPEIMVDHDFALFFQMWTVPPHSTIPDTMDMMFNFFSVNGKTAPSIAPLNINVHDKVRLRFGNISMMQHPVHLHGHTWYNVATGSGDNPRSSWTTGNTVLIPVGQTLDVIVENVDEVGNWLFHCHLPHHVTNNMEINPVPGEMMKHGEAGMFTLFRVVDPSSNSPLPKPSHHHQHTMKKPKPGIYKGKVHLDNGKKILTQVEIVKVQLKDEWRSLKASIKFLIGEKGLGEYEVFDLNNIDYNFKNNTMTMETLDKGIRIDNISFMHMGGNSSFMGKLSSDYLSISGKVKLSTKKEKFVSEHTSLRGEYIGQCFGKDSKLQIETLKGLPGEDNRENNSFGSYSIKGRFGQKFRGSYRNVFNVLRGDYDFFNGNLNLEIDTFRRKNLMICQTSNNGKNLTCGNSCNLKKVETDGKLISLYLEGKILNDLKFFGPKEESIKEIEVKGKIDGNYHGGVYIKGYGKIRPISLSVISRTYSKKPMEIPRPYFTSAMNIYLGKNFKSEHLNIKFSERTFVNSASPMNTKKQNKLTIESEKYFFVIKKWSSDGLIGKLYHRHLGMIGDVVLQKDLSSLFMTKFEKYLINPLKKQYNSEKYTMNLEFINDPQQESIHGNFLYPLSIKGNFQGKRTLSNSKIDFGTLNPFTSEVYFILEDGRTFYGSYFANKLVGIFSSGMKKRSKLGSYKQITLY